MDAMQKIQQLQERLEPLLSEGQVDLELWLGDVSIEDFGSPKDIEQHFSSKNLDKMFPGEWDQQEAQAAKRETLKRWRKAQRESVESGETLDEGAMNLKGLPPEAALGVLLGQAEGQLVVALASVRDLKGALPSLRGKKVPAPLVKQTQAVVTAATKISGTVSYVIEELRKL